MKSWILLLMSLLPESVAAQERCHNSEIIAAMSVPFYIESWSMMHLAFLNYGKCDDGAPAEAFSENIVRLLAESWALLPQLTIEAKADPDFEAFVLKHIDGSAPKERLDRVQFQASNQCSSGSTLLCDRIAKQAAAALSTY